MDGPEGKSLMMQKMEFETPLPPKIFRRILWTAPKLNCEIMLEIFREIGGEWTFEFGFNKRLAPL